MDAAQAHILATPNVGVVLVLDRTERHVIVCATTLHLNALTLRFGIELVCQSDAAPATNSP